MIKYIYIGLALVVALAAAGAKLYIEGKRSGANEVIVLWQEEKSMLLRKANEELMKARQQQEQLQHRMMVNDLEKQREIDNITRRYNDAIDSLRQRPTERATSDNGIPDDTTPNAGCTGAGLARTDAEFLVRYSADAAKLQAALNSCKAAYDAVREAINQQEQK